MMQTYKPNLKARIKSLYPQFIINLFNVGEYCEKCGVTQSLAWQCEDDELWKEINGTKNGVLCPECFSEIARKKNKLIFWSPYIYATRNNSLEEWEIK